MPVLLKCFIYNSFISVWCFGSSGIRNKNCSVMQFVTLILL